MEFKEEILIAVNTGAITSKDFCEVKDPNVADREVDPSVRVDKIPLKPVVLLILPIEVFSIDQSTNSEISDVVVSLNVAIATNV